MLRTTEILLKHGAFIGNGSWLRRALHERINPLNALRDSEVARTHTLRHGLGSRSLDIPTATDPMKYNALEWALNQSHPIVQQHNLPNPRLREVLKAQGPLKLHTERTGLDASPGRGTWDYPELGIRYAADNAGKGNLHTVTVHSLKDSTPSQLARRDLLVEEAMKAHPDKVDPSILEKFLSPFTAQAPKPVMPAPVVRGFNPRIVR